MGAPDVITNPWQNTSQSNPNTDATAAVLRSKHVAQQIPVYEQSYQFSVPPLRWDMGWKAPDVAPVAGPTYPYPVQAPDVVYANKAYRGLVAAAASPAPNPNRQSQQVSAPPIQTTF